jgi:hypothetical protein
VDVYIPANATIDRDTSTCAIKIDERKNVDENDGNDPQDRPITMATTSIMFYDNQWNVKLTFSNSTTCSQTQNVCGSAGWMAWTIVGVEVQGNMSMFPHRFETDGL